MKLKPDSAPCCPVCNSSLTLADDCIKISGSFVFCFLECLTCSTGGVSIYRLPRCSFD